MYVQAKGGPMGGPAYDAIAVRQPQWSIHDRNRRLGEPPTGYPPPKTRSKSAAEIAPTKKSPSTPFAPLSPGCPAPPGPPLGPCEPLPTQYGRASWPPEPPGPPLPPGPPSPAGPPSPPETRSRKRLLIVGSKSALLTIVTVPPAPPTPP